MVSSLMVLGSRILFFKGNLHGLKACGGEPQVGARGSGGGLGLGDFRAPRLGAV